MSISTQKYPVLLIIDCLNVFLKLYFVNKNVKNVSSFMQIFCIKFTIQFPPLVSLPLILFLRFFFYYKELIQLATNRWQQTYNLEMMKNGTPKPQGLGNTRLETLHFKKNGQDLRESFSLQLAQKNIFFFLSFFSFSFCFIQ